MLLYSGWCVAHLGLDNAGLKPLTQLNGQVMIEISELALSAIGCVLDIQSRIQFLTEKF